MPVAPMIAHCVSVNNCKVTFAATLIDSSQYNELPPRSRVSLPLHRIVKSPVPLRIIVLFTYLSPQNKNPFKNNFWKGFYRWQHSCYILEYPEICLSNRHFFPITEVYPGKMFPGMPGLSSAYSLYIMRNTHVRKHTSNIRTLQWF